MNGIDDFEYAYQRVLLDIGRFGMKNNIFLVFSHHRGRYMAIPEGDARESDIGYDYDLIGTYVGSELPRFVQISEDIYEYIKEKQMEETLIKARLSSNRQGDKEAA
jgi:hypothetical protein